MANIRDVAQQAGVGIGTVSRYLNNSGYVSEETRARIEAAVQKLDFIPNQMARNLSRRSNGIVGIIIIDIAHPFYAQLLSHVEMELYYRNYKTIVCNSNMKSNREKDFLELLKKSAVDGIIIHSRSMDVGDFYQSKKPIVTFDVDLGRGIPMIHSDHAKGGVLAARKLLECGCTHIAQFLNRGGAHPSPIQERFTAFEREVKKAGLKVLNVTGSGNYVERVNKLFNEHPEIDGIFAVDLIACAALKVAYQRKIPVPEKLKIVAYDGTYVTKITPQTITAVVQPLDDLAKHTVNTIVSLIENRPVSPDTVLDVFLREGETT
jgi:LacI family sucrose operon transcriptional repressor